MSTETQNADQPVKWWGRDSRDFGILGRWNRGRMVGLVACWIGYGIAITALIDYAPPRTAVTVICLESVIATLAALVLAFKK